MKREEKRKKLHEAVLNTLYPPQSESEDEEKPETVPERFINITDPDDFGESSSSISEDEDEIEKESGKLTRAQRKRLRKKKLKEDSSRRGKLIGPLPPPGEGLKTDPQNGTPGVRQNAAEKDATASGGKGEEAQVSRKRLKHRRLAKKLAKEKLKSFGINDEPNQTSGSENCTENHNLENIAAEPEGSNHDHGASDKD